MTITNKKLLLSYVSTGNNVSVNVIVKSQGLESNLLEGKIQPFAVNWPIRTLGERPRQRTAISAIGGRARRQTTGNFW